MNTYFQVTLTVKPKSGGAAELVVPKPLQGQNYDFISVKGDASEGIVRVEAPETAIKMVEADSQCKRLTVKQVESVRKSYPAPKLKQVFRLRDTAEAGRDQPGGLYELDAEGNKIVDTMQTVRSGFYLVDVPVVEMEN